MNNRQPAHPTLSIYDMNMKDLVGLGVEVDNEARPKLLKKQGLFYSVLGKTERGQEIIEFAIMFPILVLLAFGVLDLGRLFHASIVITNAAREGARYGTLNPDDLGGTINATLLEALDSGIDLASSTVYVACPEGCSRGTPVRVSIDYDFELAWSGILPFGTLTLSRYAEMMVP
jgi:hypothetical protein